VWCSFIIRNIKIYSTADTVSINKKRKKDTWFRKLGRKINFFGRPLAAPASMRRWIDLPEATQREYSKTNAISGVDVNYDFLLGDVADSGIDNVVEQFTGALATYIQLVRVETVTLTGTSGTCNITCDGITALATFNSDLPTTAGLWVVANNAAFAANDITLSLDGETIIFTQDVAGHDFVGATSVANVSGDLDGTVNTHGDYQADLTETTHSTVWNTRGGSEATELIDIISDEIKEQYSRPKQLIQMPVQDLDESLAFNPLDCFQDDINQYSGSNRKFVINRGEFIVKQRYWNIDLIEII
ncbi:MAG: hypothetical protein KJ899_15195, partial [Gammaproteobacteria bacterium]|nr:hypothetical protein [Gammaproteobacteria bacterium]